MRLAGIWPLLLLLVVGSCRPQAFGPGVQDFTKRLPNGYMLARTSAHQIQIVPRDGWGGATPIIPTKVIKLNTYRKFIVAYRQGVTRRSPDNPEASYMIPEAVYDYWILDSKTPKVYSKLSESEFEAKKAELGIPGSLKLVDVYEF